MICATYEYVGVTTDGTETPQKSSQRFIVERDHNRATAISSRHGQLVIGESAHRQTDVHFAAKYVELRLTHR